MKKCRKGICNQGAKLGDENLRGGIKCLNSPLNTDIILQCPFGEGTQKKRTVSNTTKNSKASFSKVQRKLKKEQLLEGNCLVH